MKILIIGGTVFVGRHIAEAAIKAGYTVTLFNRGKTNPNLFPEAEKLTGDRECDLAQLEGRNFDVVIDTCGYLPHVVRKSCELLSRTCPRYVFISTCSVYEDKSQSGIEEGADLEAVEENLEEAAKPENYGAMKALCENVVQKYFPDTALVIRPGLIVGPHDPTGRFAYWLHRASRDGKVLAPGKPERLVQFLDVRDLATWTMSMIERKETGTFNAVGNTLTMHEFLHLCKQSSFSDAQFAWVSDQELLDAGLEPWTDLPLWLPEQSALCGLLSISNKKAVAAGLHLRPPQDTIKDTLFWIAEHGAHTTGKTGISHEREREILEGQ